MRRVFRRRTDAVLLSAIVSIAVLVLLGTISSFVVALVLLAAWSFIGALARPIRSAYLNGIVPSEQRATVLSFDSLMGSAGGVVAQPALGRIADVSGYGVSYVVTAAINVLALPLIVLARRENASSDAIRPEDAPAAG
jgi:MFS family permease